MNPLISILMPVWNCASTLATAVRSVCMQTYSDWEMLIIDDGSRDATAAVALAVTDRRIRFISDGRGNLGLSARLNQGIDLARGRYIARMDGDDISFPQRLERQLEYLERNPGTDLVGCGMVIFRRNGEMVGVQQARRSHAEICGSTLRSCLLPHATWMGCAEWFRRHRYRDAIRRAEDRELLLRSRDCSHFAGIPEPMYGYRVDHVSIRKNTRARMEYLSAALADARNRGNWTRYVGAGAAELGKLALDTVALASHTDRLLLRHRARAPRDPEVATQWRAVWSSLQSASGNGEC